MMESTARLVAASGLLMQHWPGETSAVVFEPSSAKTHLVGELAWWVIQRCQDQRLNLDSLSSLALREDEDHDDGDGESSLAGADAANSDETAAWVDARAQLSLIVEGLVSAGILQVARP